MTWPEVIKLFSCSIQLSMKFKMHKNIDIAKIDGIFRFNLLKPTIFLAHKSSGECYNVLTKFCQLSRKLSLKFAALK